MADFPSITVSVIIPVFNERETIAHVIQQVRAVDLGPMKKELVVVDDGSTDGTREILSQLAEQPESSDSTLKVVFHPQNRGKGGAVKTGFAQAQGEILVIQDADLEYDPQDYPALFRPITSGQAQVVYGSRRLKASNKKHSSWAFFLGGNAVTFVTNRLFGTQLTDEPTCYKTFHRQVLDRLTIESDGFEWEPEVTAKIAKQGIPIVEVPISYFPRPVHDGKKISWKDGVRAFWTLFKYRVRD